MNARMREDLTNIKKIFELLGIRYIENSDKQIIDYVSNALNTVNTGAYQTIGAFPLKEALSISIDNLQALGLTPNKETISVLKAIKLRQVMEKPAAYSCYITYTFNDQTHEIDASSGKIDHYKTPIKPDLMSPLHLGREHIHAIKETNYEEYIDGQIIGDVLPIFYELLMCDKYPETRNHIIKFRLSSLIEDKAHYDRAIKQLRKREDKDLYKVIATRSGQYLNSFYYALQLYSLYRTNPKEVLEAVQSVLKHEITTRELLELFGLFRVKNFDTFNNELEELTKTLHN